MLTRFERDAFLKASSPIYSIEKQCSVDALNAHNMRAVIEHHIVVQ